MRTIVLILGVLYPLFFGGCSKDDPSASSPPPLVSEEKLAKVGCQFSRNPSAEAEKEVVLTCSKKNSIEDYDSQKLTLEEYRDQAEQKLNDGGLSASDQIEINKKLNATLQALLDTELGKLALTLNNNAKELEDDPLDLLDVTIGASEHSLVQYSDCVIDNTSVDCPIPLFDSGKKSLLKDLTQYKELIGQWLERNQSSEVTVRNDHHKKIDSIEHLIDSLNEILAENL